MQHEIFLVQLRYSQLLRTVCTASAVRVVISSVACSLQSHFVTGLGPNGHINRLVMSCRLAVCCGYQLSVVIMLPSIYIYIYNSTHKFIFFHVLCTRPIHFPTPYLLCFATFYLASSLPLQVGRAGIASMHADEHTVSSLVTINAVPHTAPLVRASKGLL